MLYNENQMAQKLACNLVSHYRTTHIDICHHSVHEAEESKEISLKYLPTEQMMVDSLMKGLNEPEQYNYTSAPWAS